MVKILKKMSKILKKWPFTVDNPSYKHWISNVSLCVCLDRTSNALRTGRNFIPLSTPVSSACALTTSERWPLPLSRFRSISTASKYVRRPRFDLFFFFWSSKSDKIGSTHHNRLEVDFREWTKCSSHLQVFIWYLSFLAPPLQNFGLKISNRQIIAHLKVP